MQDIGHGQTVDCLAHSLQALLGMARCLHIRGMPAAALDQLNSVIAQQPWFLSALAEKAKLLVAMQEWDQAVEVVNQLLQQEPDNIQALHLSGQCLKPICLLPAYGRAVHACTASRIALVVTFHSRVPSVLRACVVPLQGNHVVAYNIWTPSAAA